MTSENLPKSDWQAYLVEALKEDLNSKEAEISAVRNSLRYRVGGWVLEAWPPSYRTVIIAVRMLVAFTRLKKRDVARPQNRSLSLPDIHTGGEEIETVVFGAQIPKKYLSRRTFCSNDPEALVVLLDKGLPARTLVIRQPNQAVARRVERLRLSGWRIVWWPERADSNEDVPQAQYLAARADECRTGEH